MEGRMRQAAAAGLFGRADFRTVIREERSASEFR
jgi:hypothetical protein